MAQVMTFPKEFQHQFFRDVDKSFFLIWLVTFVLSTTFFHYMSTLPVKELTAEDVKRYTEVIYRVKATPPKTVETVAEESAPAEVTEVPEEVVEEKVEEEKDEIVETQQVSEEVKKERREGKRAERRSRQELRRQKVQAAAQRMKILAGPTATGGRRTRGGAQEREALGLTSGKVEGADVKKMVGMVGDAGSADKVKKARGTGVVSEDVGDIDIEELRDISADDLDMMFQETSIELNKQAITARGRGAKSKERNQAAISEIVMKNKNQVQYCYWSLKRRDSSLKGRVVAEFTIDTSGAVIRVRFRQSEWGGNPLGSEVEKCIKNVISSWQFEPIDPSGGNVTAGATYVFG